MAGAALVLLATLAFGGYMVVLRPLSQKYGPVSATATSSVAGALPYLALVGTAMLLGQGHQLRGGHPGVQRQGHAGVPQVVGPSGERGGMLGEGQRGGTGTGPQGAVGAVLDEPAAHGLEDAPVGCGAVPLEVGAEQLDKDRGDGDGPGFVLGAVLEAAGLAGGAVVGPVLAGPGGGGGQVDAAPAAAGEPAVGLFQHDGFGGAQVGVVQAGVERFQVLAAVAVAADGGEQAGDLGGAGDHAAVDGLGDGRGLPPDPVDRVGPGGLIKVTNVLANICT